MLCISSSSLQTTLNAFASSSVNISLLYVVSYASSKKRQHSSLHSCCFAKEYSDLQRWEEPAYHLPNSEKPINSHLPLRSLDASVPHSFLLKSYLFIEINTAFKFENHTGPFYLCMKTNRQQKSTSKWKTYCSSLNCSQYKQKTLTKL